MSHTAVAPSPSAWAAVVEELQRHSTDELLLGSLGVSFIFSAVVTKAWVLLTQRYYPKSYEEKPEKKVMWAVSGLSLLWPSTVVPILATPELVESVRAGLTLEGAPGWRVSVSCGLSLGYMLYDLLQMTVLNGRDYKKAAGAPLWKQMIGHHILSIALWPYGLNQKRATQLIAYFLFTEITNIGLNARFFCLETKHWALTPVQIVWVLLFFAARIAPAPWLVKLMLTWDYSQWSWLHICLIPTCLIPLGLNFWWFYLIMKGVKKLLGFGPKPKAEKPGGGGGGGIAKQESMRRRKPTTEEAVAAQEAT